MAGIKLLATIAYRFKIVWFGRPAFDDWKEIRLIVLLNHTSLFEPLFLRLAPYKFIWKMSKDILLPGADVTMLRPVFGKFIKLLLPGCTPISRKKDETWQYFLSQIKPHSLLAILPEGRMKRKNGLDKMGNSMSVRGGIADIIEVLDKGKILFIYSGGLHHIQSPGEKFPKLFKTISVNLEAIPLIDYKNLMSKGSDNFKQNVMADLNFRLTHLTP